VTNLFLGLGSIAAAVQGHFPVAGVCLLLAVVVDGLDGRIARSLGVATDFGKELDSLADVVTFGTAPMVVAMLWGLRDLPRLGWVVPSVYVAATAARLARFNVQVGTVDSRYFVGLPCPAAAGAVATFFLVLPDPEQLPFSRQLLIALTATLAFLMVSTFRYWSFKRLESQPRRSFRVVLPIAAGFAVLAFWPELFLPLGATVYLASGPILSLWNRLRKRPESAAEFLPKGSP
jgi:CDP-diacylglycerol--serine O-phosphatidyltransferase